MKDIIQLTIGQLIGTTSIVVILLALLQWLFSRLIENSIKHKYDKFLEEYRWENKTRERAQVVAEYLSLMKYLKEESSEEQYMKANRLSWELAMWLPEEIYKEMAQAIVNPSDKINMLTTIISSRKLILGDKAGNLSSDDVAHHASGISKK